MPFLTNSPVELTTAATDALLALLALCLVAALQRHDRAGFYLRLWQAVFISLAAGSLLGAVAHGFRLNRAIYQFLWHPLYFFLGLALTLLVLVSCCDWRGEVQARRLLRRLVPAPFLLVGLTWIGSGDFLVFILFEVLVMLFVLAVYIRLSVQGQAGAVLILAGVVVTMTAATVQSAGPFTVRLVWLFDHNGIFHLVQLPGIVLFYLGAAASLKRGTVHDDQKN